MAASSLPADWRMDGKTVMVTGATSGIGRAGALALARLGANLVVVGRNSRRVRSVVDEIKAIAPSVQARGMTADLASLADVRQLAAQIKADVPRLDVLLNNAGVFTRRRSETRDGFETQFGVNHLAPFLLTNLLVDHLAASAPSRVVVVASQVEKGGTIDFDDLQGAKSYDGTRAYRQSKLANILFVDELSRRVAGRGITTVSLHPGVYTTRLLDGFMGWSSLMTRVVDRGVPAPESAGDVLARAAAWPTLEGREAVYLHEHAIAEPSPRARDPELARRLWTESARLIGLES
jgi:retinol dehydrogenase 14